MSERRTVLDENLSKLFKRAWQPAPCRQEFRDACLRRILAIVRGSRERRLLTFPVRLSIAAALLLAGGFVAWLAGAFGNPDRGVDLSIHRNDVAVSPGAVAASNRSHVNIQDRPRVKDPADSRPAKVETLANAPPHAAAPGDVWGSVVDALTGAPVASAAITWIPEDSVQPVRPATRIELKDPTGAFVARDVPPGHYTFFAQAEGYATCRIANVRSGSPEPFVFRMERGVRVRGRVVESAGGKPIEGALVFSEVDTAASFVTFGSSALSGGPAATTGADGYFEIEHASAGEHVFHAAKPGWSDGWSPVVDTRRAPAVFDISLSPGASLRGTVRDAAGYAIAGDGIVAMFADPERRVFLMSLSQTVTNRDGSYQFRNLPPGRYTIVRLRSAGREVAEVLPVVLGEGGTAELNFGGALKKSRLKGRVADAQGQFPKGYSLTVVPAGPSVSESAWRAGAADASGNYQFDDLDAGTYQVYLATPFGWQIIKIGSVVVAASSDQQQDFALPATSLGGSVRDVRGDPVPGAIVVLQETSRAAAEFVGKSFTDSSGNYHFPCIAAGTYRVAVYPTKAGLAAEAVDPIVVGTGTESRPANLVLPAGGDIEVAVADAEGRPVAHAVVSFFDAAGREFSFGEPPTRTDREGRFLARGAKEGPWTVRVTSGGATTSQDVDVSREKCAKATLRLPHR
jgi:hypothetical protein